MTRLAWMAESMLNEGIASLLARRGPGTGCAVGVDEAVPAALAVGEALAEALAEAVPLAAAVAVAVAMLSVGVALAVLAPSVGAAFGGGCSLRVAVEAQPRVNATKRNSGQTVRRGI